MYVFISVKCIIKMELLGQRVCLYSASIHNFQGGMTLHCYLQHMRVLVPHLH